MYKWTVYRYREIHKFKEQTFKSGPRNCISPLHTSMLSLLFMSRQKQHRNTWNNRNRSWIITKNRRLKIDLKLELKLRYHNTWAELGFILTLSIIRNSKKKTKKSLPKCLHSSIFNKASLSWVLARVVSACWVFAHHSTEILHIFLHCVCKKKLLVSFSCKNPLIPRF